MGPAHHRSRIELFAHVGHVQEFGQSPPDLYGIRRLPVVEVLRLRVISGSERSLQRAGALPEPRGQVFTVCRVIGARRIRDPGAGQAMVGCATKCRGMCLRCRHQALPEFEAVRAAVEEADLAALLARVFPRLGELEAPILEAAGLSMWEYAIMTELASADAISQSELSQRVRRDPTRLGRHLDALQERDLVSRTPAEDKRQRTVSLTAAGAAVFRQAKREIRRVESALLEQACTPAEAASLRSQLERLAEACSGRPSRVHSERSDRKPGGGGGGGAA